MADNARRTWIVVLIVLGVVLSAMWPPDVQAFDHVWNLATCENVAETDQGLWDDMPGAGANNESGLLWFRTNSGANERCTYGTDVNGVDTTSFPQLRVRAAVNDGAILHVYVVAGALPPTTCADRSFAIELGRITSTAAQDNSVFRVFKAPLTSSSVFTDQLLCLELSDDPDGILSIRAAALIDDIRIWNPTTGAIGWRETFTRPFD